MQEQSRTLLVISQVYPPDPTAVGQYLHDVAKRLRKRGWRVRVLTARAGFDDPRNRYPWAETLDGVEILRLPLSSFGKRSITLRLLAGSSFTLQTMLVGVFRRNTESLLISTSPPMAPLSALFIGWIRRVKICFWAMDINPDQMVALGKTRQHSLAARYFDWMNRKILRRADTVVTLDEAMKDRLVRKADVASKIHVVPPWPLVSEGQTGPDNGFKGAHGLNGKFVVMYSGNHALSNPVDTVLRAASRLEDDEQLLFVFIGGGEGKREIDELIARRAPINIRSLPYQPLSELEHSLTAADVHLVSVGNSVPGICHPSKVYGIMAVGKAILYLGPDHSPVADLIRQNDIGWRVSHGDVDGLIRTIRQIRTMDPQVLREMGERGRVAVSGERSGVVLCDRVADLIEG